MARDDDKAKAAGAREAEACPPELLTLDAVAGMLSVSHRTLYSWMACSQFPQADVRIRGVVRWRRQTVLDWIDAKAAETEAGRRSRRRGR